MAKTKRGKNSVRVRIEKILQMVRPYIQMHGGYVELVEVKDGVVKLKIYGACIGCPLADLSYNKTVGTLIKQAVPQIKKVVII